MILHKEIKRTINFSRVARLEHTKVVESKTKQYHNNKTSWKWYSKITTDDAYISTSKKQDSGPPKLHGLHNKNQKSIQDQKHENRRSNKPSTTKEKQKADVKFGRSAKSG